MRLGDDLGLVHAHQRAQNQHLNRRLDGLHVFQRLAGHLPQGVAGYQGAGLFAFGDPLGDPVHETAVEQRPVALRAVGEYLFLNPGQRYHVELGGAVPACQHLDFGLGLAQRVEAGVGVGVEVDVDRPRPPFGHPPGGHRRVDAAAGQDHYPAAGADGQAAGPGGAVSAGVDPGFVFVELDVDLGVGPFEAHRPAGGGDYQGAYLALGFGGGEGQALVGALGANAKAALVVSQQLERHLGDRAKVYRRPAHPGVVGDAEDAGQLFLSRFGRCGVDFYQYPAVQQADDGIRPQGVAQPLRQKLLEVAAVLSLEGDLVIVDQKERLFYHLNNLAALASVICSISLTGFCLTPARTSRV